MGEDSTAVVDSDLKVRGINNLRVIDSSVFPTIPNGNLNAPTMMLAERGADIIKGKLVSPDSSVGVFVDPKWETRQRELG
jgi:choline dehydrogenase